MAIEKKSGPEILDGMRTHKHAKNVRLAEKRRRMRMAIPPEHAVKVIETIFRHGRPLDDDDVYGGCTVDIFAREDQFLAANARFPASDGHDS